MQIRLCFVPEKCGVGLLIFLLPQAQLAQVYGKSRSAISKILRPENIMKLKNISETGVHKGDVARHIPCARREGGWGV